MNEHERAKFDELLDAGVPPLEAADRAREIREPADTPRGCGLGCALGLAVIVLAGLLLAGVAAGVYMLGSW